MCMKAYEDRASVEETTISAREIGQDYLDLREREALWGSSAVDNQAKISRAVSETKGMYLTWEGKLIEPAYFWLSAGTVSYTHLDVYKRQVPDEAGSSVRFQRADWRTAPFFSDKDHPGRRKTAAGPP